MKTQYLKLFINQMQNFIEDLLRFQAQTPEGAEKRMCVGKILDERVRLIRIWFNSFDKDDWKRKTKQEQKYK